MELFKLFGTIAIENAEANQALDDTADKAKDTGKSFDDLSSTGEKTESKLTKFFNGAAKGNFTMMDNLGVAMNDTTLNAYALSKGIGLYLQKKNPGTVKNKSCTVIKLAVQLLFFNIGR